MIRNMAKIDLDKFISSICKNGYGSLSLGDIRQALTDQELEYKDGEIIQKSEEISKDKDREYTCQTKPENYTRREIMIYNLGIFEGKKMAEDNKIRKELKMILEDYCSYEAAKLLKEKGFDEPCTELNKLCLRDGEKPVLKVTHQKAMKWLREKNILISIWICPYQGKAYWTYHINTVLTPFAIDELDVDRNDDEIFYNTYEEAVEAALKYSLENLI